MPAIASPPFFLLLCQQELFALLDSYQVQNPSWVIQFILKTHLPLALESRLLLHSHLERSP